MDFRELPKVDVLASARELAEFESSVRVMASRRAIERARRAIRAGKSHPLEDILEEARTLATQFTRPTLKPVVNMSGTIIHTGLGRARLAQEAVTAMMAAAQDHVAIEFDVASGARGDRQESVADLLCHLTGAEDAFVVNNGAAAVVLALRTLADDKEVLLSRGQMVEIGGSFRVPDIVRESGCHLVEVGCTNRTHLEDYAISSDTGAILTCHKSNYEIVGFTAEPSVSELSRLGVPVVDDMGTGCILDLSQLGLPKLRTLADSIREGAQIAIGSGDKLLGGPQAGLILGQRDLVQRIRSHPLARAMRVDKLTLAGLRATLALYAQGRYLEIPTIKYLARSVEEVQDLANRIAQNVGVAGTTEPCVSEIGGGSGASAQVPSFRVGFPGFDAETLGRTLRQAEPAIIGRIEKSVLWLDPRSAEIDEVDKVVPIIRECLH